MEDVNTGGVRRSRVGGANSWCAIEKSAAKPHQDVTFYEEDSHLCCTFREMPRVPAAKPANPNPITLAPVHIKKLRLQQLYIGILVCLGLYLHIRSCSESKRVSCTILWLMYLFLLGQKQQATFRGSVQPLQTLPERPIYREALGYLRFEMLSCMHSGLLGRQLMKSPTTANHPKSTRAPGTELDSKILTQQ